MTGLFSHRTLCPQGVVFRQRTRRKDRTPRPSDLAETAATMSVGALSAHYRVHHDTITRWLADAGLKAARRAKAKSKRPANYRKSSVVAKRCYAAANYIPRDVSLEGRAADVLRRLTFVFRCTEAGAADQQGNHWRYGNTVLTGPELVERAKRHGFDPDEWQRIPVGKSDHAATYPRLSAGEPIGDHATAGA